MTNGTAILSQARKPRDLRLRQPVAPNGTATSVMGPASDEDNRQRIFELLDECIAIAEQLGDRTLATLVLGTAMVAARRVPKRRDPRHRHAHAKNGANSPNTAA